MDTRPLHSEAEYDAALKDIERYLLAEPAPGAAMPIASTCLHL
jgi:hypothetical protein